MRSLKRHFSLITALFAILFAFEILVIVDRVLSAYESKLSERYAIVVVSDHNLTLDDFNTLHSSIKESQPLSTKNEIEQIEEQLAVGTIDLSLIKLPYFYALTLDHYPDPDELAKIAQKLKKSGKISRVETFSAQHDTLFKLLVLFKWIITLLSYVLFAVTLLLITKEMRLWQFQHHERMNIMSLFGAPVWLRSGVLFRLAFVDAIFATILTIITFVLIDYSGWIDNLMHHIGLDIVLFSFASDPLMLLTIAMFLSTLLAVIITLSLSEEV